MIGDCFVTPRLRISFGQHGTKPPCKAQPSSCPRLRKPSFLCLSVVNRAFMISAVRLLYKMLENYSGKISLILLYANIWQG